MEPTQTSTHETTDEVSKKKTYPHDEDDIKYEKEIVDAIKKLSLEQRFQFIALNNITLHKKQQDLDLDAEMKVILNRYNKLQDPLTKSGDELIAGRALTESELESIKSHLSEEETAKFGEANKQEVISKYWYTAIQNCPQLNSGIQEHDKPILEHLTQIDYQNNDDNDNFTIVFHFSPNDYFENTSLSVKFFMANENEPEKSEATEIKWKEGKNVTKKFVTKKQKNKKTGKSREIKKEVDAESFFNFFKTIDIEKEGEAADEEEGNDLLEKLDLNFEIAKAIEDELLPYHLEYFLGIREPSDGDDDDYQGLDDEDDDDLDDEEDEPKAKKGKAKPKKKDEEGPKEGAQGSQGGDQKQECKQQ